MALTDNLVFYIGFNDGTANASVGTNGTLVGSPTSGTLVGSAITLNGSSQYVNLNQTMKTTWEVNASLAFWFKTTSTTSNISMFGARGSSGYYAPEIIFNQGGTDGKILYAQDTDVGGTKNMDFSYTDGNLNDGNPHHLVITKTGGKIADFKIYIDGVERTKVGGSDGFSSNDTGQYNTTKWNNNLAFGASNNNGSIIQYFPGTIDEVGHWDRTLTSDEVTTLYNGGAGLTYPFITGWSKKIFGVSAPAKILGVAKASISKVNGVS